MPCPAQAARIAWLEFLGTFVSLEVPSETTGFFLRQEEQHLVITSQPFGRGQSVHLPNCSPRTTTVFVIIKKILVLGKDLFETNPELVMRLLCREYSPINPHIYKAIAADG